MGEKLAYAERVADEKRVGIQDFPLPVLTMAERVADGHLALVLHSVVMMKSMLEQHLCVVLPALIKLVRIFVA